MTRYHDRPAFDPDDENVDAGGGAGRTPPGRSRGRGEGRRKRATTVHEYYLVHETTRFGTLCAWLDQELKTGDPGVVLVFVKNKYVGRDLAYSFNMNGFEVDYYDPRDDRLERLGHEGGQGVFIVSDYDVERVPLEGVTHVLHFHVSNEPERYERRLERAEGVKSIAFVTAPEHAALSRAEGRLNARIRQGERELDETLGDYRFARDPDAERPGDDRDRGRGRERDGERGSRGGRSRAPRRADRDERDGRGDERPRRPGTRAGGRDGALDEEGYRSLGTESDGRRFVFRYRFLDEAPPAEAAPPRPRGRGRREPRAERE